MRRTNFLSSSLVFGATMIAPAMAADAMPSAARAEGSPRRTASQFFADPDINFVFLGVLGGTYYRSADVGAALAIADQIQDGNAQSAFTAFTRNAERVRAIADAAAAVGHKISAREAYLQSSSYGFAATYFCDRMGAPQRLVPTWARSRSAMEAAFALFDPPVERVSIPYEKTTLPGYFFKVDDSGKRRPLLLLVNGSDGSMLDMWTLGAGAAAGVERGYNCLAFDGPGQGAALWLQHLFFRPDWEKVVTPVVDYALRRPEVDAARIAIQGISQGGYWVPRALAFEHRIAAAVVDPGVVDVSTSWTGTLPPPMLALLRSGKQAAFDRNMTARPQPTFAFRARPFGFASPFDVYTAVQRYTLEGIVDKIRCPLFITEPDGEQFWPGQSKRLYDALPGPKTMTPFTVAEGGEYHCEPMAAALRSQRIFDWLDATLA